jgi:hypothetical protein
MTKKDRKTLFTILGVCPETEEQAKRAALRLEVEAKRINLWIRNADRLPRQTRGLPDVTLD